MSLGLKDEVEALFRDVHASYFAISITRGPEIAILFISSFRARKDGLAGASATPLATRCATAHPSNLVTLRKSPPFGKAWDPVPGRLLEMGVRQLLIVPNSGRTW